MKPIPIIAPKAAFEELKAETEASVLRVLASGDYILGAETLAFEKEVADYLGVAHAVGVSSGTEALLVALQDLEIGPSDEVIVPCFTFIATATVVARLGARPVFVDIDADTFQMSKSGLEAALSPRTRAVIPVHLYGHPAPLDDYLAILALAPEPVPLIEDAAQAIGTWCRTAGRLTKAGSVGLWGCFSFYPTKNLPACGEAGVMVTSNPAHAERARQLRSHGMDAPYRHQLLGGNARLDALQSAVLRVRLRKLDEWNVRRRANAALYDGIFRDRGLVDGIDGFRLPPADKNGEVSNFHQYTLRLPRRDELKAYLQERGIAAGIYYPIPVSLQPVFSHLGAQSGDFPAAEAACREVLSLPVHQHLEPGDVERVAGAVVDFYGR